MITTNNDSMAELVCRLRNHGASVSEEDRHHGPKPYTMPDFDIVGYNYRMTDLQGVVGIVQLRKLNDFLSARQRAAEFYNHHLHGISWLRTPTVPDGSDHGWQSYVCYVDESRSPVSRDGLMEKLQAEGISSRVGTHAVHMLGYYRKHFHFDPGDFPGARDCDRQTIAIPLHNNMSDGDYRDVVQILASIG